MKLSKTQWAVFMISSLLLGYMAVANLLFDTKFLINPGIVAGTGGMLFFLAREKKHTV